MRLFIAIVIWQTIRGALEGIRMYQPGPREHPWFGVYHFIDIAGMVLLGAVAILLYKVRRSVSRLYLAGLAVLAWEAFEVAYFAARMGQAEAHENILGVWSLDGSAVWWLHAARFLFGAALIIGGKR